MNVVKEVATKKNIIKILSTAHKKSFISANMNIKCPDILFHAVMIQLPLFPAVLVSI